MRFGIYISILICAATLLVGCSDVPRSYGREKRLSLAGNKRMILAVAPTVNLSGTQFDPLLQSDLVFHQLQSVKGVTAIPVNRVVEIYASLRIDKVQNEQQAGVVCDLLGADALIVPTVTSYDPYNPPKMGASLQMIVGEPVARPAGINVRELVRSMTPPRDEVAEEPRGLKQAVGMFDATNGTVRERLYEFAEGRNEPSGPLGAREYLVNMDRFSGFVWAELIEQLIVAGKNGR